MKKEVFNNVGNIYNELYDIYKRKYNKKKWIDSVQKIK